MRGRRQNTRKCHRLTIRLMVRRRQNYWHRPSTATGFTFRRSLVASLAFFAASSFPSVSCSFALFVAAVRDVAVVVDAFGLPSSSPFVFSSCLAWASSLAPYQVSVSKILNSWSSYTYRRVLRTLGGMGRGHSTLQCASRTTD